MTAHGRWAAWGDDPPEPDHKDIDGWAPLPPPSEPAGPVTLAAIVEAMQAHPIPEWCRAQKWDYVHIAADGSAAALHPPSKDGTVRLIPDPDTDPFEAVIVQVSNGQATRLGEFVVPVYGGAATVAARILEECYSRWWFPAIGTDAYRAHRARYPAA